MNDMVKLGAYIVTSLAALNMGMVEFANYDLLVDALSLGADMQTAAYGVFGAAGVGTLADLFKRNF